MPGQLVQVTNLAGEVVGNISEKQFARWKRDMGGDVGLLCDDTCVGSDGVLIDSCSSMRKLLPPGEHRAVLLRRTALPADVRQQLGAYESWKRARIPTDALRQGLGTSHRHIDNERWPFVVQL